jgi:hypothetical protein
MRKQIAPAHRAPAHRLPAPGFLEVFRQAAARRRVRATAQYKRSTMNNGYELYFDNDAVYAVTPEGKCGSMPLETLFQKVLAPPIDLSAVILPKGVIRQWARGNAVIWLYEREPQPYNFKWIAADSKVGFGRGAKYRQVSITLPYLLIFAVYAAGPGSRLTLSSANEAFFRTRAARSLDDEVCFPALLNCSKFPTHSGHPLSWICTQYLDRSFDREPDLNRRMHGGFKSLLNCMLDSGFNRSSEHHEGASWFSESCHIDDRVSTIEKWEAASKQDPFFVLDVPWLKSGYTINQMAERIFNNLKVRPPSFRTAADVARVIFSQPSTPPTVDPLLYL